jgi:histidine ammonia-lyase
VKDIMMLRKATALALFASVCMAAPALAQAPAVTPMASSAQAADMAYRRINPTMVGTTVTLNGHDLTLEQVIQVARYGAKVQTTAAAKQHMNEAYGLLLEGSSEGIAIYWFNRGAGGARETVIFAGDPESATNRPIVAGNQMRAFQSGAAGGYGPEVSEEEIVRAMMVIRANAMIHNAPSPGLAQMLVDLINHRITPVVNSRGTVGEGDLGPLMNVGGAMVGAGDVYYNGVRMKASDALSRAGLKPIVPFAADNNALSSSNGYATAQAALLTYDAKLLLEWMDLAYAMDLVGMNSSVSPIVLAVQADRPEKWLNWHAAKTLDMIKGSYLFDNDPKRIIQDPESLRASSIRQASAWKAWSTMKDTVLFQMNSSDHNPVVKVGLKPTDSWEMNTPQMLRYYVKGGPRSNNKGGFILSNANWDPYPMANEIEAFTLALANVGVAQVNRMQRFSSPFFTGVAAREVIPDIGFGGGGGYTPVDLWQEVQSLAVPITPEGNSMGDGVEELQAQTRLKTTRARAAVDAMLHLTGFDLTNSARWLDVRQVQGPERKLGDAPTAAWKAFRAVVPLRQTALVDGGGGAGVQVYDFLKANPASKFYAAGPAMPAGEPVQVVKW